MPNDVRHVEEERHEHKYERHPLVVVDLVLAHLVRVGQRIVRWHIVGVGYPANVVGIGGHRAGELSGRPAGDRIAHVLTGADEEAEEDEQRDGVAMAQTVAEVVILDFSRAGDALEDVYELPDHVLRY